jgi:hypothetical protein
LCNEIIPLLIEFFPKKENTENTNINTDNDYYQYVEFIGSNIIKPIIESSTDYKNHDTTNQISINNVSNRNISRLLDVFIKNADKSQIITYLCPENVSQLLIKFTNSTGNNSNISELLSLMEALMTKCPEHFIVSFIRGGIIEKLKNCITMSKKEKEKILVNHKFSEMMNYQNEEEYNEENDDENNEDMMENEENFIDEEENTNQLREGINLDINNVNNVNIVNIENNLQNKEESLTLTKEKLEIKKIEKKDNNYIKHIYNELLNNNQNQTANINNILGSMRKTTTDQLEEKITAFYEKFFSEENINRIIKEHNLIVSNAGLLIAEIKEKIKEVQNNYELFGSYCEYMEKIIEILMSFEMTNYEIENSEVFHIIAQFIDSEYNINCKKINIDDESVLERVKILLSILFHKENYYSKFVHIIHNVITTMNLYTVNYDPYGSTHTGPRSVQLKLVYNDNNSKILINDINYQSIDRESLIKINELYSNKAENNMFTFSSENSFIDIQNKLLHPVYNKRAAPKVNFYLICQNVYNVEKKLKVSDLYSYLKEKLSPEELKFLNNETAIYWEFSLEDKDSLKDISINNITYLDIVKNAVYTDNEIDNVEPYNKKLFIKNYNENVVKACNYEDEAKLTPYLYIQALFEILHHRFISLAFINGDYIKGKEILINEKLSASLLKILSDPNTIHYNSVPKIYKYFATKFSSLLSFESRYLLFKTILSPNGDVKRGLVNLSLYNKAFSNINSTLIREDYLAIPKNKRFKIVVEREKILTYAENVMKDYGNYQVNIYFILIF